MNAIKESAEISQTDEQLSWWGESPQ